MAIDWQRINTGNEQFPKIFDFTRQVLLRRATKKAGKWEHELLEPPLHCPSIDLLEKPTFDQLIGETIRAYCAYTMQVAERPMAPQSSKDRTHAVNVTRHLHRTNTDLSEYLRFHHEIRGISFMNVQVCTWGYLAGNGQLMQHSAYSIKEKSLAARGAPPPTAGQGRAGVGHVVNTFEGSTSAEIKSLLVQFNPTDTEVKTVETLLRGTGKGFVPTRLRSMADHVRAVRGSNANT